MRNIAIAIILCLTQIGCNSREQANKLESEKESWKVDNYIDSVQILLTNAYQLNDAIGDGASSFLLRAKGDILLCTAKHLLGEDMGISPEIKTENFNSSFVYWKAFPRINKLTNDTIVCTRLVTEKANTADIILQECKVGNENKIVVLNPRFSKAKRGEKFEIIGCEYSDYECHQRKYYATMDSYEGGKLIMKSEKNFTPSGFSGAPVIDGNGLVIGVLSGGGELNGALFLAIEPLSKIETYLK